MLSHGDEVRAVLRGLPLALSILLVLMRKREETSDLPTRRRDA
jgi:hypothetical protein